MLGQIEKQSDEPIAILDRTVDRKLLTSKIKLQCKVHVNIPVTNRRIAHID